MFKALTGESFSVLWRAALVKAPRLVPPSILSWTDPEGPFPEIVEITSRGDHKIPVYLFIKQDLTHEEATRLPVVIDFHGGGFVLGSCLEQAPFCSKLARELGAVIISVDYRMGPINKFPAAVYDAEDILTAVLKPESTGGVVLRQAIRAKISRDRQEANDDMEMIHDEEVGTDGDLPPPPAASSETASSSAPFSVSKDIDIDTSRIAFSGFSSGANLALNLITSVTEPDAWPSLIPDKHPRNIPALLFYPSLDARQLPSERPIPAHMPKANKFWEFTGDVLAPSYLPRDQAGHHRASPGLAPVENIHNNARMLLILPALDSLAAQSEVWVEKVEGSDRKDRLEVLRYPKRAHGWTQFPDQMLDEEARQEKNDTYDKSVEFVLQTWNGKVIEPSITDVEPTKE
jgi:acetyl esterase/lipase